MKFELYLCTVTFALGTLNQQLHRSYFKCTFHFQFIFKWFASSYRRRMYCLHIFICLTWLHLWLEIFLKNKKTQKAICRMGMNFLVLCVPDTIYSQAHTKMYKISHDILILFVCLSFYKSGTRVLNWRKNDVRYVEKFGLNVRASSRS